MTAVIRRYGVPVARLVFCAALPAAVLLVLAVLDGMVRTAALAAFAVCVVLRGLMVAAELGGQACPTPRFAERRGDTSAGVV